MRLFAIVERAVPNIRDCYVVYSMIDMSTEIVLKKKKKKLCDQVRVVKVYTMLTWS